MTYRFLNEIQKDVMNMQKKRVTIYDIAKKLKVSPSTVSRVLGNSNYPVSDEMRAKILKAAKEMNYYPNLMARNLKKRDSKNIGIVLPSISNPFYPSVVRGIEDEAYENDYILLMCSCDRNKEREKKYFQYLMENFARGIITIFTDPTAEGLSEFVNQGGVVLSIHGEKLDNPQICSFYFDKSAEGYTATKHLIDLGHKKIAFLSGPLTNPLRIGKFEGYKKALTEAGIPVNDSYIYIAQKEFDVDYMDNVYDCQIGLQLTRQLLLQAPEVTAIVCINDMMALGCISQLQDQGYKVPEDYSVVGFDDSFFSNLIKPRITTVRFEKYNIGRLAMRMLNDIIEGKQPIKHHDLSNYTNLEIRESSGKPRE